jgi:hypothetical protein
MMQRFEGQTWTHVRDPVGSVYEDLDLVRCTFSGCSLGDMARHPDQRTIVRHVRATDCMVDGGSIGPVLFDDVQIKNLRLRGHAQWVLGDVRSRDARLAILLDSPTNARSRRDQRDRRRPSDGSHGHWRASGQVSRRRHGHRRSNGRVRGGSDGRADARSRARRRSRGARSRPPCTPRTSRSAVTSARAWQRTPEDASCDGEGDER